jgi:hypothetical protein
MAAQDLDQALALGWVDQPEPFLGRAAARRSGPKPRLPAAAGTIFSARHRQHIEIAYIFLRGGTTCTPWQQAKNFRPNS